MIIKGGDCATALQITLDEIKIWIEGIMYGGVEVMYGTIEFQKTRTPWRNIVWKNGSWSFGPEG